LLVCGLCIWQIGSQTQAGDPLADKMAIFGLGLLVAGTMHLAFMMQLVRRTGRSVWPWFFAIVFFMPIGTAVLLALLLGESEPSES